MINERLRELGEYIEEIKKKDTFDFLVEETKKLLEIEVSEEERKQGKTLQREFTSIIEKYEKELPPPVIVEQLLNVYTEFLIRKAIESKAVSLGIERSLYKREMGFLFKGKQL